MTSDTNIQAGERTQKVRVDSVKIRHMQDDSPDASYLEQPDLGFEERLQQYRDGQFGFIGIVAEAVVSYDCGQGNRRLETLTSGGIWGVEDDSGEAYIRDLENEELSNLKEHLAAFGVEVSYEWLCEMAERGLN